MRRYDCDSPQLTMEDRLVHEIGNLKNLEMWYEDVLPKWWDPAAVRHKRWLFERIQESKAHIAFLRREIFDETGRLEAVEDDGEIRCGKCGGELDIMVVTILRGVEASERHDKSLVEPSSIITDRFSFDMSISYIEEVAINAQCVRCGEMSSITLGRKDDGEADWEEVEPED